MGRYILSSEADADIEGIARTSLHGWGIAGAEKYILGLHDTFARLAEFPDMGRNGSHIRDGTMLLPTASHTVFYRKIEGGVLIVRVLHARMDFERHF